MPSADLDPSRSLRTSTTPLEAAVVVAVCFGWAIVSSLSSLRDTGSPGVFSNASLVVTMVMELGFAAMTLMFLRWRGYAVVSLRPEPNLIDSGLGVALLFGCWIFSALVISPFAAEWSEQPIAHMVAQAHLSLPLVVVSSTVNGAFEETFLLGVLTRGLRGLGASTALGLPLLVRILYHVYQGPIGALSVAAFGLLLGVFYLRTGRLWPVVAAHVLADIVAFFDVAA